MNIEKYLIDLQGKLRDASISIVWWGYTGNWSGDFKKDKKFIFIINKFQSWQPYKVYVNGQSILAPKLSKNTAEIRYIEPEFKRLMEV